MIAPSTYFESRLYNHDDDDEAAVGGADAKRTSQVREIFGKSGISPQAIFTFSRMLQAFPWFSVALCARKCHTTARWSCSTCVCT